MDKFIVKPGGVVEPAELIDWARWFENAGQTLFNAGGRIVARDKFTEHGGGEVSTVFLGLDHGFRGGKPLLFETMIFDRADTGEKMCRYSTIEEARAGHAAAQAWAKGDRSEDF